MLLTEEIKVCLPYPIEEKARKSNAISAEPKPFGFRKCTKQPPSAASDNKQWKNVLYCNPQIFLRLYDTDQLPFLRDFSGHSLKLKWRVKIEVLNLNVCLPVLFAGLLLKQKPMLINMSIRAIEDILIHRSVTDVAKAIKHCVLPLQNLLLVANDSFLRRILNLLITLVSAGQAIIDELLLDFRRIFYHNYRFWLHFRSSANVNYGTDSTLSDYELITELMNRIEKGCSRRNTMRAYRLIKGVMPTYSSCVITTRTRLKRTRHYRQRKKID